MSRRPRIGAPIETVFGTPVPAGTAVLNGSGELTSSLVIREWGRIETPVYLTSTHAVGLARCGSVGHHGSGEIFVAFAPPGRRPRGEAPEASVYSYDLNDVFEAVVDATEEAVLNALWAAPEVTGREGRVGKALPHDDVLELLGAHGRLGG